MTTRERLTAQLLEMKPVDDRERTSIQETIARLSWPSDPFDEVLNPHHVTASAFVVSERGVILHRHKRLGIWVQPGGHIDHGESPEDAAQRETFEETGLAVRHVIPPLLFHVDVHPGPRGHTHYDLRYVLLSEPNEPSPAQGESPQVYWFSFEGAQERCEPALRAGLSKLATWYRSVDVKE